MRAPSSRPIAFQTGTLDVEALQAAGGSPLPEGDGISIDGWTVQSRKGPIMRDALADDFKQQLGDVHNLPEQLFRDSFLRLTHVASGVSLQFDAQAALREWGQAVQSPVQVKAAEAWQRAREQDLQGTPTLKYDCTLLAALQQLRVGKPSSRTLKGIDDDRTYTTPYCGSVRILHSTQQAASPSAAHAAAPAEAEWMELGQQMDKSLLMEREPILYFDDLPLYESELDDNGVSQLRVKVRVMPRCWYVLLRFWLRVDNVLVRMRDTRMMCTFGSRQPQVHRELKWSEGTFAELRRESAPANQAAYADADATAVALQAVEPVGIKLFRTEQLMLKAAAADPHNMDLS